MKEGDYNWLLCHRMKIDRAREVVRMKNGHLRHMRFGSKEFKKSATELRKARTALRELIFNPAYKRQCNPVGSLRQLNQ